MNRSLDITVIGTPGAQGSKTPGLRKDGTPFVRESNKDVRPWRQDVVAAATAAMHDKGIKPPGLTQGPIEVWMIIYLRRPMGHFSAKGDLKASAPEYPTTKRIGGSDEDKFQRSTKDALTNAGVYRDDSQIVDSHTFKRYADGHQPGALIRVRSLLDGKEPSGETREDAE